MVLPMMRLSRWPAPISLLVVSSLWVTPLACVLTCLLGGCLHAAQSRAVDAAAAPESITRAPLDTQTRLVNTRQTSAPAALSTERVTRHTPACCATRKPAKPADQASLPGRSAKDCQLGPHQLINGDGQSASDGEHPTRLLTGSDDAGCGCHRSSAPTRFTVTQTFTFAAPLPTVMPARLTWVATAKPCQPRPVAASVYLASRRETYLKHCVFRI